jgi:RNA polymerase sigma-70 factor (ECF subfamily)
MTNPDQELIERLLHGDARAFDEFFNEYYPKIYRFVKRRIPQNRAAAEDIAQATLCRALESLDNFRGEATLMTWLCTLCRREMSVRWQETHDHSSRIVLAEDNPEIRAALESLFAVELGDPLFAADREQVKESILTALDYLPTLYADILEWKYVHDISVADIAQRLGRTPKAVESLLTRAREAFREAFALLHGGATDGVTL